MPADLVIKNCQVVLPDGMFRGGVAISNGKITKIASDNKLPSSNKTVDGKGKHLLPGIIDIHVHFREPGYEYKEDFSTGSMAAAAGGVTTVLDMPSGIPYIDSPENLKKKFELVRGRSCVDYGQYCMIADYNLNQLEEMVRLGAIGFKLYMSKTAVKVSVPNDSSIFEAFKRLSKIGVTTSVHAENDGIITSLMDRMKQQNRNDIFSYAEARPRVAEAEAIQRAAIFSQYAGNKIHILHLSSKDGLGQIIKWKKVGVRISAETCPHYLLLSQKHLERLGAVAKINPPIKSDGDRLALWEGIRRGQIGIIATDHSPHKPEEKKADNVWDAAAGFTGVETSLPLMLTEVCKGELSLRKYVQLAAENPAKLFRLYPRKGVIRVGSDADFVLVDLKKESVIKSENLKSKTKVTPFEGWKVRGTPVATFLRGQLIMENDEIIGNPSGRMVKKTLTS